MQLLCTAGLETPSSVRNISHGHMSTRLTKVRFRLHHYRAQVTMIAYFKSTVWDVLRKFNEMEETRPAGAS